MLGTNDGRNQPPMVWQQPNYPPPKQRINTPGGPMDLLNTAKSTPRTQAIEQANTTDSPFLRLPSEIRNRIYEYTFGGRLIHVNYKHHEDYHQPRPRLSICSAEQHEHEAVQEIRDSDTFDESRFFEFRHQTCRYYGGTGWEFWKILDLLRTCRQVHREAAFLPYELNTFHFYDGFEDVPRFTSALVVDQLRAIHSIGFFFVRPYTLASRFYPDISNLGGVQHLSIFLQLNHTQDVHVMSRCKNDQEREDLGLSGFFHFFRAGFPLQSASVTILSVEDADPETLRDLKDWGMRVERKLLAGDESNRRVTKSRGVNGDGMVEIKRSAEGGQGSESVKTKKQRLG